MFSPTHLALPTLPLVEGTFMAVTILCLVHALQNRSRHRALAVFFGAQVTGTANDLIFMSLPLVDNFWHAHASVMVTSRLPLYIIGVYTAFLYLPSAAVDSLRIRSQVGDAALAAILGALIYAPLDVCGVKFLWWTWHNSDAPLMERWLGVPCSSTTFVLTFVFSFRFLLRYARADDHLTRTERGPVATVAIVSAFSTLMMMTLMTIAPLLAGDPFGMPGFKTMYFLIGIGVLLSVWGILSGRLADNHESRNNSNNNDNIGRAQSYTLFLAVLLFAGVLAYSAYTGDPSMHISTGLHQPIGPCDATGVDLNGQTRYLYVCTSSTNGATAHALVHRGGGDGGGGGSSGGGEKYHYSVDCKARFESQKEITVVSPPDNEDAIIEIYSVCGTSFKQVEYQGVFLLCEISVLAFAGVIFGSLGRMNEKRE